MNTAFAIVFFYLFFCFVMVATPQETGMSEQTIAGFTAIFCMGTFYFLVRKLVTGKD